MSVGGGQVKRGVVAHVGRVDPRAAGDEHLDDLGVAALGRPVQRRELMVVPARENGKLHFSQPQTLTMFHFFCYPKVEISLHTHP